MARKNIPKFEDLNRAIGCICTECESQGTLYPFPAPMGTMYCPKCSPSWLKPFLEHALKEGNALGELLS
jgi:hypothetical protein